MGPTHSTSELTQLWQTHEGFRWRWLLASGGTGGFRIYVALALAACCWAQTAAADSGVQNKLAKKCDFQVNLPSDLMDRFTYQVI